MTAAQDKMRAFTRAQPTATLAGALALLDSDRLTPEERQARAVIIDVLCDRIPAADQAFQAWAENEEPGPDDPSAVEAILAAITKEVP